MSQSESSPTNYNPPSHGILSLVDELLLSIIDQVDGHKELCSLAVTCMRLQGLVEPYIWRKLLILTGSHARLIAQSLNSRDERLSYIKEISIRYKDEYRDGIEELNPFIGLMGNLRHLTLESPCPNNSEWSLGDFFDGWSRIDYPNLLAGSIYPRLRSPRTLPMLQSCKFFVTWLPVQHTNLTRPYSDFTWPWLRELEI